MRYHCYFCEKSVTSDLPDGAVIRAILVCPECVEAGQIRIVEPPEPTPEGPAREDER